LEFDCDHAKGKAFLTSCWTYICLCLEAFKDETIKIVWAMSYMKSGWAGHWATREFEYKAASRDRRLRFLNWVDFEDELHKDFLPLNVGATALNILETSAYFQGKRTVDDYLDQFQDLVYDSGYTDPKTIVVKFCQGLDQRISATLAGMVSGRLSDTDLEAWFNLAVQMDQNRPADEAFQASHHTTSAPAPAAHSYALVLCPPLPACCPICPFKPLPGQSCSNGY
jgi:hypothetical protein